MSSGSQALCQYQRYINTTTSTTCESTAGKCRYLCFEINAHEHLIMFKCLVIMCKMSILRLVILNTHSATCCFYVVCVHTHMYV